MEKVNTDIGFLGLGACGSNVAELSEQYGYKSAIMNTSPEDLAAVTNIFDKFLIGKKGGCGKNRRVAKNEVKLYYKDIVEFVKNRFDESIKIIYVVYACGGGTGSGMSPIILDMLTKMIPDKKFACIAILPTLSESGIAQYNTLENLSEISKLNIPIKLIDNEKFISNKKLTKKQLYDTVNKSIISDFNNLFKERTASKYGNMDVRDLYTLLLTPGVSVTARCVLPKDVNDVTTFNKQIMLSCDRSIYAEMQYDRKIKRLGFIYEISDALTRCIDYSELEKDLGKPIEIFEGTYTPSDEQNIITTILTGLTFPEKRIKQIQDKIEELKNSVSDSESRELNLLEDNDINWLSNSRNDIFSSNTNNNNSGDVDLAQLFSNY